MLCERLKRNTVQFTRLPSAFPFRYRAAASFLIAFFVSLSFEAIRVQADPLLLIVLIFPRLGRNVQRGGYTQLSGDQTARSANCLSKSLIPAAWNPGFFGMPLR